jgi:hypothetical protein
MTAVSLGPAPPLLPSLSVLLANSVQAWSAPTSTSRRSGLLETTPHAPD